MLAILLKTVFGVPPLRGFCLLPDATPSFQAGLTHSVPPALENSLGRQHLFPDICREIKEARAKTRRTHGGRLLAADHPISRSRAITRSLFHPSNPGYIQLK